LAFVVKTTNARTPGPLIYYFNASSQAELNFHFYTAWRLPQIEEISKVKVDSQILIQVSICIRGGGAVSNLILPTKKIN
jgi:hypothetical protein